MLKNQNAVLSLLITSLMTLIFAGCGGGGGGGGSGGSDDDPYGEPDPIPTPITRFADAPTSQNTSLGEVLINSENITLYTFENDRNDVDNDGSGDSDCNGGCATTWPPMLATANATTSGDFSIIERDDGNERQWAFKGLPLYMFASDSASGDVNGEGVSNTWFVARPDPFKTQNSAQASIGNLVVGAFSQTNTDGSGGEGSTRVDRDGFTLYTFENDRNDTDGDGSGDSDCNATCAEVWPPLYADSGATAAGDYSIITRDDGSLQWALNGLPLYFFASDVVAGDTNGEGVNDVWFIARPTPITVGNSTVGGIFTAVTPTFDVDDSGSRDTSSRARTDFSLYVFDDDVNDTDGDGAGDSDCNATCAVNWPPMYADAAAVAKGHYSIIDRDDGTQQWAYKGEPLYFFVGDSAAGDVTGDQIATTWHLARNAPVQIFTDATLGNIFAARGMIEDVDPSGGANGTFTNKTGFTVYLFDDDASDTDGDGVGDSDCNGGCAVTWPPLYANADDIEGGEFTIITRDDGSLQWAYKGSPLYFFAGDSASGDTAGVYGTWHEVTP